MKNSETIYNIYRNGILVDNNLTGEEVYLKGYTDDYYNIVSVMSTTELDFLELIEEYKYEEAAKMYFDRAYQYRNEFNIILNERNVKNKVMDIMYRLDEYGEYNDQI